MRQFLSVLLVSAVASCAPTALFAQNPVFSSAQNPESSKIQLFSGYSAYRTGGAFNLAKASDFVGGWAAQLILENSRWGGLVVDFSRHEGVSVQANEVAFGPRFQKPISRFVPFGEAFLGLNDMAFKGLPSQVKPVWIAGGGVDVRLTSGLSMRPIEISYVGASYNTQSTANSPMQTNSLYGVRVQSGLIYNLSRRSSVGEVLADCRVEPPTVDAGVMVKIDVKTKGFPSKRKLRYTYVATGGSIAGNTAMESVDTKGLSPGNYTISATVVNNGGGKNRLSAGCEAKFNVTARVPAPPPVAETAKAPEAPAETAKVPPAPSARVETAKAAAPSAPDVQESTNAGNAPAATVTAQKPTMAPEAPTDTAKAPPAPSAPVETAKAAVPSAPNVQESTNASNAPAAAVTAQKPTIAPSAPVETAKAAPPSAPPVQESTNASNAPMTGQAAQTPTPVASLPPQPSKYGVIAFSRDRKRPTRVDNEAKGELDRYADALATMPDCRSIVVGNASAKEGKNRRQALSWSSQRAVNTKNYLTKDKGIDPARIEPRIGSGNNPKTELWIVPAGGSFRAAGTTVVDESKVKAVPRISLKARKSKTRVRTAVHKLPRSRNRHRRRVASPPMRNTANAALKTVLR